MRYLILIVAGVALAQESTLVKNRALQGTLGDDIQVRVTMPDGAVVESRLAAIAEFTAILSELDSIQTRIAALQEAVLDMQADIDALNIRVVESVLSISTAVLEHDEADPSVRAWFLPEPALRVVSVYRDGIRMIMPNDYSVLDSTTIQFVESKAGRALVVADYVPASPVPVGRLDGLYVPRLGAYLSGISDACQHGVLDGKIVTICD